MTAQDLIKSSARALGIIAAGETPTNAELTDGLESLNMLLDSWANKRHIVYALNLSNYTLTVGIGSYTIGSGGAWNTTRPQRIECAYIRDGSNDYPIEIISKDRYNGISNKTSQGMPDSLFYDSTYALGNIYLYPVPDKAYALYLDSWKPFTKFSTLTETVTLPPGYERALKYNLAIEIAPEYGRQVSTEIAAMARDSLVAVTSFNAFCVESSLGLPITGSSSYNINTDS